MKNTLRIGDAIYTILKDFKNVYPVKADEGTTFPFIIYRRVSGDNKRSKDGIYSSIAHIEVYLVAQSNEESIELAEKVLQKLEAARGPIEGFDILRIRMIDRNESWIENSFIQCLKFSVEFSICEKYKACTDM